MITLAFMESKLAYLEELKHLAQYFNIQFPKIFQASPLMNFYPNRKFFALNGKYFSSIDKMFTLFLSLCNTISSVSPEVKTNAQKRSIFHLIAHGVLDNQCKRRYFWLVPEPLAQQLIKKKTLGLWGREWVALCGSWKENTGFQYSKSKEQLLRNTRLLKKRKSVSS